MCISTTLSKSDFQLASTCPKKLIYKKQGYPTSNDTNEYMEMLAKGGYVVGMMATLLYPDGIEITGSTKDAIVKTNEYLKKDNCILFEAAFQSGEKLIRVDILEKIGSKINLIEVKAKSHDSEDDKYKQEKLLEKYIEDVAYQYLVLTELFPSFEINPFLLMPDKSKRTHIDGLAGWFSVTDTKRDDDKEVDELPAQLKPKFKKPEVVFKYENDTNRSHYIELLKRDGILQLRDVKEKVLGIQDVIRNRANTFISILREGIKDCDYSINKNCKSCEYNSNESGKNGFKDCWGILADAKPHIFDLYYGGAIKNENKQPYLNDLISQSKTCLFDVSPDCLKNKNGEFGVRAERQLIQLKYSEENSEWISDQLLPVLNECKYPLHFIDFETYTGALPFHEGMRPYELIAFQWSCHTIPYKGATPIHSEWIETEGKFPNFVFAESLMKQIGHSGTPFMWATHENTVLRTILNQMEVFGYENPALSDWLIGITSDKGLKREGRLVDMNELTKKYYFHPEMHGRTSIKKVLPAIWNNHHYLHQVPFFKEYSAVDFEGGFVDPYDTLMVDRSQIEEEDAVSGGTDAMRAFQRIRFDDSLNESQKNEIQRQLLAYCKLDTMAMVIIAHHWGVR